MTPCTVSRNASVKSTPQRGRVSAEPLFGADASQHRHTGGLPGSGLSSMRQAVVSAGGDFNEREMTVVRAASVGRRSFGEPKFEISMHGQWKGLRGKGGALCSGAFRYPLFGNAVYEGLLVSGLRHGAGRQVSHSGVYDGEFKDGEMSGSGRRLYCDGGCYEGEWHAGLKHGQGKLFLHEGDSYEGHFYEGEMHGRGVYCLANGDTYSGGMRKGLMHGEGEYCFALPHNGRYKGQFVDNVRHGKGTLEFEENGLTYRYAGDFNEDAQTGRAVLHISNGDKYSGEFQDGRFHGHGEYVFKDGSRYEGEFADGVMHGVGSFVAAYDTSEIHGDGERFQGQWRNGVRHGKGVVKLVGVTGETEEIRGAWHAGVREGDFVRTTSWGRVVYERCVQGKRAAFSLGQQIMCPGHVSLEVQERASPQKLPDAQAKPL